MENHISMICCRISRGLHTRLTAGRSRAYLCVLHLPWWGTVGHFLSAFTVKTKGFNLSVTIVMKLAYSKQSWGFMARRVVLKSITMGCLKL